MKITDKFKNIYNSIKKSFRRFPVTIAVSIALVIISIIINEKRFSLVSSTGNIFERIRMIIALGIPLSLCIQLIYEQKPNLKNYHKILGYILGAGFLILYYKFLLKDFNMVNTVRYIVVSIFLYLAFSYIPWIKRKEDYEYYIIKVFSSFFLTAIYSFVLLMGLFAIFFTIDQLFNANIPGKIYYYTFLIVAGVFAVSYFLARIPEIDEDFEEYKYSKGLKVLLLYIVIPLISIYTLILYIYFGKILITRDWPQGIVSNLVLWYSTVSVGVIFFISPILGENKLANRFKFWFPKFNIPILIMMFISMGIRINEYGITENRYFALVLGLWVFGIMLYFIFSKKLKNIIIPIVLSIIVINSGFGPLSSFSVSKRSQNHRLKTILVNNSMLVDNKIVATKDINEEDREEISGVLAYFNRNHSLEDVKYLPKDFKPQDMEDVFGFSYGEANINGDNYFNLNAENEAGVIDVSGYDYFIENYRIYKNNIMVHDMLATYDMENMIFKLSKDENTIYEADMKAYGEKVVEKSEENLNEHKNVINTEDAIIVDENENLKIKYIVNSISGRKGFEGNLNVNSMEFSILIKIK